MNTNEHQGKMGRGWVALVVLAVMNWGCGKTPQPAGTAAPPNSRVTNPAAPIAPGTNPGGLGPPVLVTPGANRATSSGAPRSRLRNSTNQPRPPSVGSTRPMEMVGIGVQIAIDSAPPSSEPSRSTPIILGFLPASPAKEAGLEIRDHIIEIDGRSAEDMTLFEAVKAIQGQAGFPVRLKIVREGAPAPLDFTVTREKFRVPRTTPTPRRRPVG